MKVGPYDALSRKLAGGERLTADEIAQLAAARDILATGMLADEARRRTHGTRVTFVRVATCAFDKPLAEAVPPSAREVRLSGKPDTIDVALAAVRSAKSVAGERMVSGFSLVDLQALAAADGSSLRRLLDRMREAGLEMVAELPLDRATAPEHGFEALCAAGYARVRLTVDKAAPADERVKLVMAAADLQDRFGCVHEISPLPMALHAFRPTTGYEDVLMIALARLAAPHIPTVQVDWQRYGPKLAQVALTFGADDVDNVSASDEAPDGKRRAPLEEVRRNIESAGFKPVERDGRWQV